MKSTLLASSGCLSQTCQGSAVETGLWVSDLTRRMSAIRAGTVMSARRMVSLPTMICLTSGFWLAILTTLASSVALASG